MASLEPGSEGKVNLLEQYPANAIDRLRDMGLSDGVVLEIVEVMNSLSYDKPLEMLDLVTQGGIIYNRSNNRIIARNYTDKGFTRGMGQCRDLAVNWVYKVTDILKYNQLSNQNGHKVVPMLGTGLSPQFFCLHGQKHIFGQLAVLNRDQKAVGSRVIFDPCFKTIEINNNDSRYVVYKNVIFNGSNGIGNFSSDYVMDSAQYNLDGSLVFSSGLVLGLSSTNQAVYSLSFFCDGSSFIPVIKINAVNGCGYTYYTNGSTDLNTKLKQVLEPEISVMLDKLKNLVISEVDDYVIRDGNLIMPSVFT